MNLIIINVIIKIYFIMNLIIIEIHKNIIFL